MPLSRASLERSRPNSTQRRAGTRALKLAPGTNYSSWATYEAQAAAAGLVLNATLQREQLRLMPSQMAEGDDAWPQRNFEALFSLSSPG